MRSSLALACCVAGMTAGPAAGETLSPGTLAGIKAATVYLRVELGNVAGSGSGFLIRVTEDGAYLITNRHVVYPSPHDEPRRPRATPAPPRPGPAGTPVITVVFHSGTPAEFAAPATVVTSDAARDLALLRIGRVGTLPLPLDEAGPRPVETLPVFIVGFPFGGAMKTNRRSPAVTVGRAAVSSLRLDDRGDVSVVQLDGDLNPGNSGGPVVDSQGRLVAVSFALIKGTRIGLAIPAADVAKLLLRARLPRQGVRPRESLLSSQPPPRPKEDRKPLGDAELTKALEDLKSFSGFRRCAAAVALAKAQPQPPRPDVVRLLEPLLVDADGFTRRVGARALGVWGNQDTIPRLLPLLDDGSERVREAASEALDRLRLERPTTAP